MAFKPLIAGMVQVLAGGGVGSSNLNAGRKKVPAPKALFVTDAQCYRISCTTANGSPTLTLAASANNVLRPGMTVTGAGIPNGTKILASWVLPASATSVTLDTNATASATVWLIFLPAPLIGPPLTYVPAGGSFFRAFLTKEVDANNDNLYAEVNTTAYNGSTYNIPPVWNSKRSAYWLRVEAATTSKLGNSGDGSVRDMTLAAWTKSNTTISRTAVGVDGVANRGNIVTASLIGGTVTYAVTNTGNGIFTAFVKRSAGYGRVLMTCDNWVTAKDISASLTTANWARLSVSGSVANPTVGFRMETSGDAIICDCMQFNGGLVASAPYIGTPYDGGATTVTFSGYPATVAGRRYLLEATIRPTSELSSHIVKLRNSAGSSIAQVGLITSGLQRGVTASTTSASVLQYNVSYYAEPASGYLPHSAPSWNVGDEVKLSLIFGNKQISILKDGIHIGTDDQGKTAPDPMDYLDIQGDCAIGWLSLRELYSHNVVFAGDSITARPEYTRQVRDATDPLQWGFRNAGVGGDTIELVTARVATDITPYFNSRSTSNTVIIWIGTNNFAGNESSSSALTKLATLVAAIKAGAAWTVKVMECIQVRSTYLSGGTTTASFTTQATAFNAGLSAVSGVDGVIPINDMTELSSASDTQYFEDGLHLAPRGYTAIINRLTRDLFN